jgi:hypothetical protein
MSATSHFFARSHIMSRYWFALTVALAVAGSTRAADPAAAKLLTPDTRGFVHVRVGDIWTADIAKQLRTFVAQAGGGLLADFDGRFYPAPSDVESVTVVVVDTNFRDILPSGRPTDVTPVWVVTSKKPIDKAQLLKTMAPGKPRTHRMTEYYFDDTNWSGTLVLDDHSYAYASEDALTQLIDRMAKSGESPLAATFTREASQHPVTVGVNVGAIATPEMVKGMPPELQPLFKAKTMFAALDLKPKTVASVVLEFGTEGDAKAGLKAAQEAVQLGRGQLGNALTFVEQKAKGDPARPPTGIHEFPETVGLVLAAAGLKQLDGLLGAMPLAVKGTNVTATLELDSVLPGGSTAVSIAAVGTAIGIAISSAERTESRSLSPGSYEWTDRERNLAHVAKAIEKYHKDKGHYPPPAILDKDGKPLLSWRVAILPYLDGTYINNNSPRTVNEKPINGPKDLYDLFKLDEPWDGPNNKKLIEKYPAVYSPPWGVIPYSQRDAGKTLTLAVVGKGGIFDPTKKTVAESDVRDGLKQTLLLMQLEEPGRAVHWTKPADIALTADGKLPVDAPNFARRFAVVYADGSAHTLANGVDAKTLLGIFTRDGSEKLDEKVIRPEPVKGTRTVGVEEAVPAPQRRVGLDRLRSARGGEGPSVRLLATAVRLRV